MAEFLIFDKDHWMDEPSPDRPDLTGYEDVQRRINDEQISSEAKTKKLLRLEQKYDARHQRGDIVEAREDGRPRGKKEPESFAFIRVTMPFAEAKEYMRPLEDVQNEGTKSEIRTLLKRRKYRLDMAGIVLDGKKTATLSLIDFNARLGVKEE